MARSRDIEYRVGFTGDTSQLEAAVKKATDSLTKLGTSPEALNRGLEGASRSALELSNHLNAAFNQNTGKLDLIKFQQSLKASGKDIQDYAATLSSIGPEGQQAFLEVASAIGKAELPLKRTNNLIKQFGQTLWNTARWRITTSAINAIVGGMQQAYGYAKSLDASLNNIRIVTGKSAEDMARFAKEANNAAKTLSTTTTTYTDASLIYYQQGLNDEQVKQRTDTTIQMANVTGESAETISSEMTAIWNNFDDGTRSLKSFSDGMVALGATTSASSKEIAEGLEKFAPVAQTVGLSFDYAAAALTTIVAQTRESASVAGNALRTLFSRLEGLKLGETLDDGTDLNKYSSALMAVGVNIKDVQGNLKDMDTILDELGAKWQTLAKDQQMALAETVAGVRQYTQLVALMDNWSDFQQNLVTAQNSEGALQRQADIYAESWEAARKRIKASTEDIFDSLINPEQFIKLDDMFTPLLTGIASAGDALGGLTGMLPLVVMLMNKAFGDKIAQSLRDMTVNIGLMTGAEQKRARALQDTVAQAAANLGITDEENSVANTKVELLKEEIALQAEINSHIDNMPSKQKEALENDIKIADVLKEQALRTAEILNNRRELADEAKSGIIATATNSNNITSDQLFANTQNYNNSNPFFIKPTDIDLTNDFTGSVELLTNKLQAATETSAKVYQLSRALSSTKEVTAETKKEVVDLITSFKGTASASDSTEVLINKLKQIGAQASTAKTALKGALQNFDVDPKDLNIFISAFSRLIAEGHDAESAIQGAKEAMQQAAETARASSAAFIDWADALVKVGTYASQTAMAIRAIGNLSDIFSEDSELSIGEKWSQGLTSFGMLLPMVSASFKEFSGLFSKVSKITTLTNDVAKLNNELSIARSAFLNATKGTAEYIAASNTYQAAVNNAAVAQNRLNVAMRASKVASSIASIAIMAVITAISLYIKHQQKLAEQRKKENEEAIKSINSMTEEANKIQELVSSYEKLNANTDNTIESKEAIAKKALEVANALGIEGAALANLTGDYTEFNKEAAKAQQREAEKAYLEAAKNINTINRNLAQEKPVLGNNALLIKPGTRQASAGQNLLESYLKNSEGVEINYDRPAAETYYEADTSSLEKRLALIKTLQQFVDDNMFKTNDEIQGIEEEVRRAQKNIDLLQKSVAEYQEAYDKFLVTRATATSFGEQPEYYKDFQTWRENTIEGFEAVGRSASEAESLINQVITNLGYEEWERVYDLTQGIMQQLRDFPEVIEYIENYLQNHEVTPADVEVMSQMTWGLVDRVNGKIDDTSYNKEFKRTEDRIKLQQEGAQASIDYVNAEKFLQQVQSKSGLKSKDLEGFVKFFGEYENAREEMMKFLESSDEEQTRWANNIIDKYYQAEQDKAAKRRESLETEIALIEQQLQKLANFDTPENISSYEEAVNKRDQAENLITTYFSQRGEYKKQGVKQLVQFQRDTADALAQALEGKGFNFTSIWGMLFGDEETALNKIQSAWGPFINETVGNVIGLKDRLGEARGELNTIANTIELMPSFKLGQEIQIAENVKTLGELNKQYRLRNIHIEAYNKGIVKLAKSVPGAAASLKKYNDAVADGDENKRIEALEELKKLVEDDAWGRAFATVRKINDELKTSGATLEDPGSLGINQHADKLKEVAKALNEAFETDWFDAVKVQDNADTINQILNGEKDALTSIYNMIDFATAAASDDVKNALAEIGLSANQITSLVSELDGLQFGIDGYANVEPIIRNLTAVGYTAGQIAGILSALGNSIVGFEVEGLDAVNDIINMGVAEFEGRYGDAGVEIYQAALADALSNVKIKGSTTNVPPGYTTDTKSGGGGSNYQKDPNKDLEDTANRYHEINRELERQSRILTEIDKTIDRTYGTKKLDAYTKKQDELNNKLDLQRKKYDEAAKHLVEDREKLFSLDEQDLPIGFSDTLNRYGNLTFSSLTDYGEFAGYDAEGNAVYSYQKLREEIVEKYNAKATEIADKMAATQDKDSDELKKEKEELEKWFNDLEKWFGNYETSLDTYNTTVHEMAEIKRQIEDNELNIITFKLQLALDVREIRKKANDFARQIEEAFGDALTHSVQAMAKEANNAFDLVSLWNNVNENGRNIYEQQYDDLIAQYNEALNGNQSIDTTAIIEKLENLQSEIIASGEELLAWLDQVENMFTEALDAASTRFDEFTNQISHQTEIVGTMKELYALQGITYKTEAGFNELAAASETQYKGYLNQAKANKLWLDDLAPRLEEAERLLAEANETDTNYDMLKKNRDALLAEYNETQKSMLEASKNAMETARQIALDTVERTTYELEQKLTNNLGFDLLQDKFDHFMEENERYLDPVEEGLETAAWYSKLQADIDKTNNKVYQNRLKDLQEEIDLRRESNELSQYDLDILEARYQTLQAEMALEEARDNKTQLRLTRDSQGNWNYQYTSNPENIRAREQELLKARQNEYEITKKRNKDLYSELIKMSQEYASQDAEIRKQVINGILTPEEGEARLAELERYYTDKSTYLQKELGIAREDMAKAAVESEVSAAALSESVLNTSSAAIQDIVTKLKDSGIATQQLAAADFGALQDMLEENVSAFETAGRETKEVLQDIINGNTLPGSSLTTLRESFDEELGAAADNIRDNFIPEIQMHTETVSGYFNTMKEKVQEVANAVGVDEDSLSAMVDNASLALDNLYSSLTIAIGEISGSLDTIYAAQRAYSGWAEAVREVVKAQGELSGDIGDNITDKSGLGDLFVGHATSENRNIEFSPSVSIPSSQPSVSISSSQPLTTTKSVSQVGVSVSEPESKNIGYTENDLRAAFLAVNSGQRMAYEYANEPFYNALTELFNLTYSAYGGNKTLDEAIEIIRNKYGFMTGGYTGEWGDNNGRLALLHQKELVLNAQDTENILEAVHIMRGISDTIFSGIAKSLDSAGAASIALLGSQLSGVGLPSAQSTDLEQHVTIEQVNFPNVSSAREIEEAFENLVNDAAQWARRRKG